MINKSIKLLRNQTFYCSYSTKCKNLNSWAFCRVGILKILNFFDETRGCINLRECRQKRCDEMSKIDLFDVLSYRYFKFQLVIERLYTFKRRENIRSDKMSKIGLVDVLSYRYFRLPPVNERLYKFKRRQTSDIY